MKPRTIRIAEAILSTKTEKEENLAWEVYLMWEPVRQKWGGDFRLSTHMDPGRIEWYPNIEGMENKRSKLAKEMRKDIEETTKKIKQRFKGKIIDYGWENDYENYHQAYEKEE